MTERAKTALLAPQSVEPLGAPVALFQECTIGRNPIKIKQRPAGLLIRRNQICSWCDRTTGVIPA
jgi:hypothetical protein